MARTVLVEAPRRTYRRSLFEAWAAIDAAAVLDYVASDVRELETNDVDWTPLARFAVTSAACRGLRLRYTAANRPRGTS